MARFARPLQYLGIVAAVFGLGKLHAVRHAYDYTGSGRFVWSGAYVVLLAVASYSLGLPELIREPPRRCGSQDWRRGTAGALGISIAQLVTNSVLLPRLVVFGAAGLLIPWFVLCAILARHARARAEERERLPFVGRRDEAELLRDELGRHPERSAQLVDVLGCEQARSTGNGPPLVLNAEGSERDVDRPRSRGPGR